MCARNTSTSLFRWFANLNKKLFNKTESNAIEGENGKELYEYVIRCFLIDLILFSNCFILSVDLSNDLNVLKYWKPNFIHRYLSMGGKCVKFFINFHRIKSKHTKFNRLETKPKESLELYLRLITVQPLFYQTMLLKWKRYLHCIRFNI